MQSIMQHMETTSQATKSQTKKMKQQTLQLKMKAKYSQKHRLRSRNYYIDECLREDGDEGDPFADLEDFIE
jgi:hypothetical protein